MPGKIEWARVQIGWETPSQRHRVNVPQSADSPQWDEWDWRSCSAAFAYSAVVGGVKVRIRRYCGATRHRNPLGTFLVYAPCVRPWFIEGIPDFARKAFRTRKAAQRRAQQWVDAASAHARLEVSFEGEAQEAEFLANAAECKRILDARKAHLAWKKTPAGRQAEEAVLAAKKAEDDKMAAWCRFLSAEEGESLPSETHEERFARFERRYAKGVEAPPAATESSTQPLPIEAGPRPTAVPRSTAPAIPRSPSSPLSSPSRMNGGGPPDRPRRQAPRPPAGPRGPHGVPVPTDRAAPDAQPTFRQETTMTDSALSLSPSLPVFATGAYDDNGYMRWVGPRYRSNISVVDLAQALKEDFVRHLCGTKVSATTEKFSMGRKVSLEIVECPWDLKDEGVRNAVLRAAHDLVEQRNRCNSHPVSDYHSTSFYSDVKVAASYWTANAPVENPVLSLMTLADFKRAVGVGDKMTLIHEAWEGNPTLDVERTVESKAAGSFRLGKSHFDYPKASAFACDGKHVRIACGTEENPGRHNLYAWVRSSLSGHERLEWEMKMERLRTAMSPRPVVVSDPVVEAVPAIEPSVEPAPEASVEVLVQAEAPASKTRGLDTVPPEPSKGLSKRDAAQMDFFSMLAIAA